MAELRAEGELMAEASADYKLKSMSRCLEGGG